MSIALNPGHALPSHSAPTSARSLALGHWGVSGAVLVWLGLMLLLPISALVIDTFRAGPIAFLHELTGAVAAHAILLTLGTAALATAINAVMGTVTAWTLVRYEFRGRSFLNLVIDLPFAVPALVTGVTLVTLYGPQSPIGQWLAAAGIQIVFAPAGIVFAVLFVTYPIMVRSVQSALLDIRADQEEAARTLGAGNWTTFRRVILPAIQPALITGSLLSFARALGEFGSVVMVAGNKPLSTLTAAVWVRTEVEAGNYRGAGAVSVLLLGLSFTLILAVDTIQRRWEVRRGRVRR